MQVQAEQSNKKLLQGEETKSKSFGSFLKCVCFSFRILVVV